MYCNHNQSLSTMNFKVLFLIIRSRACLQFCFTELLQEELYRVARHWNTHRIRPYPNQESHPGKPDVLFFIPELKGK